MEISLDVDPRTGQIRCFDPYEAFLTFVHEKFQSDQSETGFFLIARNCLPKVIKKVNLVIFDYFPSWPGPFEIFWQLFHVKFASLQSMLRKEVPLLRKWVQGRFMPQNQFWNWHKTRLKVVQMLGTTPREK